MIDCLFIGSAVSPKQKVGGQGTAQPYHQRGASCERQHIFKIGRARQSLDRPLFVSHHFQINQDFPILGTIHRANDAAFFHDIDDTGCA